MQGLTSCTAPHDIPTQKCIQVEHTVQGQCGTMLLSGPITRISRRLHIRSLKLATANDRYQFAAPIRNVVRSC